MKHNLLTLTLLAALATGFQAQTPAEVPMSNGQQGPEKNLSPSERAKKDADQAEKKLSLNSDQKAKWEAVALERATANAPIKEKMKGCTTPQERKTYHSQIKVNQKKYKTSTLALLSPEQKTKYEQIKKQKRITHKARMKERHRHMNDGQD